MEFIDQLAKAVVGGRVIETRASQRSEVVVTFGDGHEAVEIGSSFPLGLLPLPRWRAWGPPSSI